MILYHGSNVIVEQPKLMRQNRYLDFGFGFYTTTNRDQAVNFAQKVADRRKTGAATLNIYSVEEAVAFRECSLLRFDSPDEARNKHWRHLRFGNCSINWCLQQKSLCNTCILKGGSFYE